MKLAEAFVEIRLKADRFLGSMRGVERKTEQSARRIGRSFDRMGTRVMGSLKGLAGGIAASLGLAAITAGVRSLTNELDELAKRARTLGVSPNQLAGLGFGIGQTTGLTGKQGQVAFERFTKRVGEASIGQGEGASVLKALGLDSAAFRGAGPTEQLEQFSEALQGVTDRGLKLAYVQKLLGDEARLMLPFLELERSERKALAEDLNKLRGNIALVANSAERQNDALDRAGQAMRRLGGYILLTAEPAVVGLSNAFVVATSALEKHTIGLAEAAARMFELNNLIGFIVAGRAILGATGGGGAGSVAPSIPEALGVSGRGIGSLGLNTQLGTFNVPGQNVLSVLKNIADSNKRIAAVVEARKGAALT